MLVVNSSYNFTYFRVRFAPYVSAYNHSGLYSFWKFGSLQFYPSPSDLFQPTQCAPFLPPDFLKYPYTRASYPATLAIQQKVAAIIQQSPPPCFNNPCKPYSSVLGTLHCLHTAENRPVECPLQFPLHFEVGLCSHSFYC